jgi:hypothetical protein
VAVEFKPNDRASVLQNIQVMHMGIATLSKQPVFLLSPHEAKAMTDSLCNLLDYYEINITGGSSNAWMIWIGFLTTFYGVYAPRLAAIRKGGQTIEGSATLAATPGDAANSNGFKMDFTADKTPDKGTVAEVMAEEETPRGVFNYG